MSILGTIAAELSEIDWQWSRSWWEGLAERLLLKRLQEVHGRESYLDARDISWDVYFNGENVLFVELNVDVFEGVEDLPDAAYEEKVDEYFQKFEDGANELSAVLGKPVFADGAAARGFPDDQEANWLALWRVNNARVMLQQKHEARDLPFRLCVVVAPPTK